MATVTDEDENEDDGHQTKEFVVLTIVQVMDDWHHVMKRLPLPEKMDVKEQQRQPLLHVA